jgi:hypothetical protein
MESPPGLLHESAYIPTNSWHAQVAPNAQDLGPPGGGRVEVSVHGVRPDHTYCDAFRRGEIDSTKVCWKTKFITIRAVLADPLIDLKLMLERAGVPFDL